MRFLTFNVQGFSAGVDRVEHVIRSAAPDVVALQEAKHPPATELARRLRFQLAYAPTHWGSDFGNAILTRVSFTEFWKVRFDRTRGLPRRAATAAMLLNRVEVLSTHLGLSSEERERHAARLLRETVEAERVVIGVDLNESTSGAAYRTIAARFTDVFATVGDGNGKTFPATAPREQIDYVFCSRDLTPVIAAVVPVVASDHLAVVAEIAENPA